MNENPFQCPHCGQPLSPIDIKELAKQLLYGSPYKWPAQGRVTQEERKFLTAPMEIDLEVEDE